MKKFKMIVMCLLVVCIIGCSTTTYAKTKTVTKSSDMVTVKLKYESYVDSKGRKLVRKGKIVSVKGKHGPGPFFLWEFVPKKSSLKLIDGGRTYQVSVSGILSNFTTSGYYHYNSSSSVEFYYSK